MIPCLLLGVPVCNSCTLSGLPGDHSVQSCQVSRRLGIGQGIVACASRVGRGNGKEEGSMQHAATDVARHRRFCCKVAEAYANNGNTEWKNKCSG